MTTLATYQELGKAVTDPIVTLYQLDLTSLGGNIYYFTTEHTALQFGGNTYTPFPMKLEGIGNKTGESPARPTLTVSNVNHTLSYSVNTMGDLIGAPIYRIRTFSRFLDNGATPDSNAHLPIDEYIINQKTTHNKTTIEFELASRLDLEYENLPRRLMMRDDIGQLKGFPGLSVNSRIRSQ
jgi:lambda family phage minor tail protein L